MKNIDRIMTVLCIQAAVIVGVWIMMFVLYMRLDEIRVNQEQLMASKIVESIVGDSDANESVFENAVDEVATGHYYDIPLSHGLQDFVMDICSGCDVEPAIVFAMIERESRFKADAIGDSGKSFGLMQIQKRWHEERMEKLGVSDLLDPFDNVEVGVDYIDELAGRGNGLEWALMAYNGGPSYANKMSAAGKVSDYALGVISRADELEQLRRVVE